MTRTFRFVLVAALIAGPLARSSSAQSASVDYAIGPQDVLAIVVFDQPDLSGKYAVEIDGSFTFPYVGRVKAGGLTIRAFEHELRTRLADGFFKDPQVAVSVETYRSQRIFVTGEVRTPGAFPLTGELTLLDAIAKAGFTTIDASDDVTVIRSGKGAGPAAAPNTSETDAKKLVTVSLKALQSSAAIAQNVLLQDGDTVFVGRAEPVFVYGQVKNPGSYPIRSETTVLQALSLAGGATAVGAVNRIRIIRVVNGERQEYRATLTDFVQPGDTLMVPERFF
jgi:polysaccharide export outer membrane protein